jgi:hypothetical protein
MRLIPGNMSSLKCEGYPEFSDSVDNEIYAYSFLLVEVVPFELVPRRVYATGQAFRPLPEAHMILAF